MKIPFYIISLSSLFLNIPTALASEEIENYYWKFTSAECKKNKDDLHPMDFTGCKAEAAEASTKELEKIFKKVISYIDNKDAEIYSTSDKDEWKKTLKRSQANWEKYRDLEIEMVVGMEMKGATGSGPSNVMSGMLMEKNYQRIQELKVSYDLASSTSLSSHAKTQEETVNPREVGGQVLNSYTGGRCQNFNGCNDLENV